jgi:hypothetical protein
MAEIDNGHLPHLTIVTDDTIAWARTERPMQVDRPRPPRWQTLPRPARRIDPDDETTIGPLEQP